MKKIKYLSYIAHKDRYKERIHIGIVVFPTKYSWKI